MKNILDEDAQWLGSLTPPERAYFLARLSHSLTIACRSLNDSADTTERKLEQLVELNELQHRVASGIANCLTHSEYPNQILNIARRASEISDEAVREESMAAWVRARQAAGYSDVLPLKNIQVIDGALNAVYDIFQATNAEFDRLFPVGTDVAFSDELFERDSEQEIGAILSGIWQRRIPRASAQGIHGTLFYGLSGKKPYYPTRRAEEASNPDGSRLR